MDLLWQDLRYSFRLLRKSPGFSAMAILTLALGIGATTAMFSVVYQSLLAPLAYPHPEQLVHIHWIAPAKNGEAESLNGMQSLYLQQNSRSFSSMAMKFYAPGCNLVSGSTAEYVDQAAVSPDFFRTFDVQPTLGRTFLASDALTHPAQVALISYSLWRGKLGSDPKIVGSTIKCNGMPYTVIGVLPQSFTYPEEPADVWIPDRIENYLQDIGSNYWVIGRLRDGVSIEAAQQEMLALSQSFHKEHPKEAWNDWMGLDGHWILVGLREWRVGDRRQSLLFLFGAVGLVLLIACANVAGLILTRATSRTREVATRLALGASRGKLIRQMLTETVLLGVVGGIASLLLAIWTVGLLSPLVPQEARSTAGLHLQPAMLEFALALSVLSGLVAGVLPALRATRGDLYLSLREGDRGSSGGQNRLRKVLITSEVALALLLLVGSSLLFRSFLALRGVNPGIDPKGVTVGYMSLGNPRFQKTAAVANFQRDVLARLRAIPGVTSAATITAVPGRRDLNMGAAYGDCPRPTGAVSYRAISPSYFETVGIPLLRGRNFGDDESQPVALVNEAFAHNRCWGGKDALGLPVKAGGSDSFRQIIGIVGDTHDYGPAAKATPTVYVPQWQVPDAVSAYSNGIFFWSVVTKSGPVPGLGEAIQRAVHEVDPEQSLVEVLPLETILGNWLRESRSITQLMMVFAGLALMLTAVGLYGILSYYVAQHTREIGIRMALGARQQHVLRRVVAEGLVLVAAGAVIGLGAALASTKLIKSLLFGVRADDPVTLAVAVVFLIVIALAASFVPAYRATRVDPMVALRYE